MPTKKLLGLLGAAYLLGVATPLLMLFGTGSLPGQVPSLLFQVLAVVGLVAVAAALAWLLEVSRRTAPAGGGTTARKAATPAAPPPRRTWKYDLPTPADFYRNTPDGCFGSTLAAGPDFDPASDPALQRAPAADGEEPDPGT